MYLLCYILTLNLKYIVSPSEKTNLLGKGMPHHEGVERTVSLRVLSVYPK